MNQVVIPPPPYIPPPSNNRPMVCEEVTDIVTHTTQLLCERVPVQWETWEVVLAVVIIAAVIGIAVVGLIIAWMG